MGKGVECEPA
jgi:hypothetical protein